MLLRVFSNSSNGTNDVHPSQNHVVPKAPNKSSFSNRFRLVQTSSEQFLWLVKISDGSDYGMLMNSNIKLCDNSAGDWNSKTSSRTFSNWILTQLWIKQDFIKFISQQVTFGLVYFQRNSDTLMLIRSLIWTNQRSVLGVRVNENAILEQQFISHTSKKLPH